jgi:hypothetical protein
MQKRIFNRTGYCNPEKHYTINPIRGLEANILKLIKNEEYYVIHAPRQSGKTTLLHSLTKEINAQGDYIALVFSMENAGFRSITENEANYKIIQSLFTMAKSILPDEYLPQNPLRDVSLSQYLNEWCTSVSKPIVLFIDEIDSLWDDVLISILRQLRNGFQMRPKDFPQSIALVGLRDIRDFKMKIRTQDGSLGSGSPFNIKAESFRLANFTIKEITDLYQQYTDETGQVFPSEIVAQIYLLTGGQPWLVNALAHEITETILKRDYSKPITPEIVYQAKENLIQRRDTHLDSLMDKMDDPHVKPIISAIISGNSVIYDDFNDDLRYTIDLGIVTNENNKIKISNNIYSEIIPRVLNYSFQQNIGENGQISWYLKPDGKLDMNALLKEFQEFYRENAESWINRFSYKECGHQLLLMAFLQRVINGGGQINREMAAGSGRTDLIVDFAGDRFVLELKIKNNNFKIERALQQLSRYLDTLNQPHGWLIVFESKESDKISWEQRMKWENIEFEYLGNKRWITMVEM